MRWRPCSKHRPSAAKASKNAGSARGCSAGDLKRWRDHDDPEFVRWLELFNHALHLNATPLSIAEIFQATDQRSRAVVDIHLGDPVGGRRFQPLLRADGIGRGAGAVVGEPVRLFRQRVALRAQGHAGTQYARLHASGGRGGAARARGERRPRVHAVHESARDARRSRVAQGRVCPARARISRC